MKYIREALRKNHVFPHGPHVYGLEKDIMRFTGTGACSCLVSGTAALHLALIILGVEQGDEVICSSFTFSASVNPVVYLKAIPVLVDSEPRTWNMDANLLLQAIEDRINKTGKKPKAIILVHLYGMPANMDAIMSVAAQFNIPVVEDAAEALGSTYKSRHCGTFGEAGIYSFNGNKIITTSGGGALVSKNEEFCRKATFLATQARDAAPHYQHSEIGYNYRLSNICAGIGRGQMEVLKERIAKRRENFFFYKKNLEDIPAVSFPEEPSPDYFSNHWLTTILLDPSKKNKLSPERLRMELENYHIETRPVWKPMHLQPVFAKYPCYNNGVSGRLFDQGLCLPSSTNISDEDRNFVVERIRESLRGRRG